MIKSPKRKPQEKHVDWDILDFAVFGAMLVAVGVIYRLIKRQSRNMIYRLAAGVALAASFLLLWINAAVGVIGDESNDANLMFFGVLAVGLIGSVVARLQPHGMARALYATALAQALVATIALMAELGSTAPVWPKDILILNGFFIALWLLSAALFQKAARQQLI
jgi:hypothetical protein